MPPSLFHLSINHSAAFLPEMPKMAAEPEKKSTKPSFNSLGAPLGGAALATAQSTHTSSPRTTTLIPQPVCTVRFPCMADLLHCAVSPTHMSLPLRICYGSAPLLHSG